jgi:hydroxymethylpyrimidine/phosphomethylpyrimidine kinase
MTVAGSDPSGGAGLQADLKTFHQHGVYGASAVSLVTVQNTLGVRGVAHLEPAMVRAQMEAVLEDLPVGAIKTGALGTARIVRAVADGLARWPDVPLIVDPVMLSKNGNPLLDADAVDALVQALLPRAELLTPNAPEAAALAGIPTITDVSGARRAAELLARRGARAVLVKGGHLEGPLAIDVLFVEGEVLELASPRVQSAHTHGTGCTLSAAIAARRAGGDSLRESVERARAWLHQAIARGPGCEGHGIGPVDHFAPLP